MKITSKRKKESLKRKKGQESWKVKYKKNKKRTQGTSLRFKGNYELGSTTSFTLKELGKLEHLSFIPDTNILVMPYSVLLNIDLESPNYCGIIHNLHGQVKALENLCLQRRLVLFPCVYNEYRTMRRDTFSLVTESIFGDSDLDKRKKLFQLFNDCNRLDGMLSMLEFGEELSPEKYDKFEPQLKSFNPIARKRVSVPDKKLYLSSIFYRMNHGNSVLVSNDSDIRIQPPINYKGRPFTIPLCVGERGESSSGLISHFNLYDHRINER